MRLLKLLLPLALLIGCNSTEPKDSPALSGVYEYKETAVEGEVTNQVEFKAGADFRSRIWSPDVHGTVCIFQEITGKWAYADGSVTISDRKARAIETGSCSDTLSSAQSLPTKSIQMRNISEGSFEIYQESSNEDPARWVKFTKI